MTRPLRILFVTPYTPRAIRPRPYDLLRTLAARGHQVTAAALWQSEEERVALRELKDAGVTVHAAPLSRRHWLWNCLRTLPTGAPLQARYSWQPALARQLDALLAPSPCPFDVIHVEHLRGSPFGLHLQRYGIPIVWDSVDCISLLFEQAAARSRSLFGRFLSFLDLKRTRSYEPWLATQFDRVLMTSPVDKAALDRLAHENTHVGALPPDLVTVLPNGVDFAYFRSTGRPRQEANIVFSGRMSYHANISAAVFFAHQVLPLMWAARPDVTFTIAGYDPVPEVRMLAKDPRIVVTGTVSDLRPYLESATVAVVPVLYSAGIQNKLLEAMACSTPVVATPQPVASLQATPGVHLLVAEAPADLAAHVLQLLNDRDLRQKIGEAGRQYVEQYHDWNNVVARLEQIYDDVIRRRGAQETHG